MYGNLPFGEQFLKFNLIQVREPCGLTHCQTLAFEQGGSELALETLLIELCRPEDLV